MSSSGRTLEPDVHASTRLKTSDPNSPRLWRVLPEIKITVSSAPFTTGEDRPSGPDADLSRIWWTTALNSTAVCGRIVYRHLRLQKQSRRF
ncbi:hypothetical protein HPB52_023776 [Rhipicephalus sanguineus]|uniref:Uncharacterized protein n=1 Tax=Rhipicephalus sanguineus TaxID=34632 RepID=A0A9D4Q3R5_RHISA|nr:hypothetical protein HPB52_023776 [Rhipicephalus sanguineus]